ncbi:MAG TPA: phosphoglucomutase [Bacteroidales bacterium]|nr:MAG: phosphoglucomutase [Bacteroidetes bacterium GWF2_33_38]OFY72504.1 MAG: phosphoglucomutase [Bacteroidetes bacterium RIFOXYA12_FULL_33_9]HBF87832.1 phosphoglucomutase [Bacteroidales bacterium]
MENNEILKQVKEKANKWLNGNFDAETKKSVKHLMESDENELIESFYKDLEFGTGGLRGIMGVGTNKMNVYTVGMATQGFCNYIKKGFSNEKEIRVAVACDSRNNSQLFAETTAKIFAANGFKVFLFDALRPTPELSFAIRHLNCHAGVVITASHNPKEYNGYKAYWNDGGQLIAPHDENVIKEVEKILSVDDVKFTGNEQNISIVGAEIDEIYTNKILELSLSPDAIKRNNDIKIVYTPIHGTGVKLVPMTLKKFGFTNIYDVPEQNISDGNFPTVISPNPEVPDALRLAIEKAKQVGADLVLATDPDGDRVGIAVRNDKNEFILLNGNQTGSILVYYLLTKWKQNGKLKGKEYVCKTIVTTELIKNMSDKFGVECFDVLTGFKFIAALILENEGKKQFIGGGEESYGYLAGEFVRDKDAIMACALIAEAAAWAKDNGKTFYNLLLEIYEEFGLYKEDLINVVKKGKSGAEEIQQMMVDYRNNPPKEIAGSKVAEIRDYKLQKITTISTGKQIEINMPKSNVLQFFLEDGSKITVRPSGTEPKIKFYVGVKTELKSKADFEKVNAELSGKVGKIKESLGL